MDNQNDEIQENEDLNLTENNLRLTKKKNVTQKIGVIIGLALGVITVIAILLVVLLGGNNASGNNNQCIHKYVKDTESSVEPTCTIRGTFVFKCEKCGDTYNEVSLARGHSWKSATCTEAKYCHLCKITEGSPIGHNWKNATCTTSKKCYYCGITDGEPKPHSWTEATCTEAKKCKLCRATEGSALGHIWTDATCDAPKTCERCQKTEGYSIKCEYVNGVCIYCSKRDPFYTKPTEVIPIGETWLVDGQWEVTINSVTIHYACNMFDSISGNEQVVIVNYTYKNLGYESGLRILIDTVFDENGEAGRAHYPCSHAKGSLKELVVTGSSSTLEKVFVLPNKSSQIKIYVDKYPDDTYADENGLFGKLSAIFTVYVEQ